MKAELIDHMGTDLTVVNAARVSFNKESEWAPSECCNQPDVCGRVCDHDLFQNMVQEGVLNDRDTELITYLAKHGHWTPFAHPQITVREKVPIFVARQRFKHMVGFTYNEVSRRYVDDKPEFYVPDVWRKKADNVKQGSHYTGLTQHEVNTEFNAREEQWGYLNTPSELNAQASITYKHLIQIGVCPEQARMVLPQSMYTEYWVTGSLAAWARAYKQRIDPHSQKEIQALAKQWDTIIRPLFPVSWEALTS